MDAAALGLGAIHGSEIVHIQHSYSSYIGRKLHPLARQDWPPYDAQRRASRVILSARDLIVDDPDAERRAAWAGLH
jgi:para-nitrobenzyl esterase